MEMPDGVRKKIEEFFSAYPIKEFDKGEIIIMAGVNPKHIFYILSGQAREYDITPKGDEVVVNVFKQPAFFPMSWAINKTPNTYFFDAGSKLTVRQAPPDEVVDFIKANPDVMYDLLARLYYGVDGLLRRMAHLMGGAARSRLLFELMIEAKRFGQKQSDGKIKMAIHESELGARAGLSRETVSREINDLKKSGLIEVNRQNITISGLSDLERELNANM